MSLKKETVIFPIIITLLGLIVGLLNISPNTYLTGWDTLHPEFNYALNLARTIFGTFRIEQGLGAVAAHSHMSEIPRILMLGIFDIFLPTNLVRYAYIIFTLIFGPLGMYFFLKECFKREFSKAKLVNFSSFIASVFYMLNLGTLQQFVVPFEMFNALYAFLPWILLFAIKYIYSDTNEQKKYLFYFILLSLLASPMAYAPALWYMHFGLLCVFLFILSLPRIIKKDLSFLKRSIYLTLATILINTYWLLPHIYFLLNHSSHVSDALVNKLFSDQAFYYNKQYGNFADLSLLKSFLFSWNIYLGEGHYSNLLSPWIEHLNNKGVSLIGYLFAIISLIGLIYSVIKKKIIFISIFIVSALTLFFLLNDNPPFGFIFTFMQETLPLFKEAFRFPHTKLFIHYIFVFSVFFGVGAMLISNLLLRAHKYLSYALLISLFGLIIFFMFPAFRGNYISPQMKIDIPKEYFESAKYLNSQEDMGKVALLPINSFWGWDYHDWGYQGAGFNWFNIKQPVLHRNFDRWSETNEQFYKEMSDAIYSQDPQEFEDVISKYGISYLIFDKSVIAPENDPKVLFRAETEKLLSKQEILEKKGSFGKLDIYQIKNPKNLIYTISNPKSVNPEAKILNEDKAFNYFGDYISDNKPSSTYFPFRNLINNEGEIFKDIYKITNDGIELKTNSNNPLGIGSINDLFVVADVFIKSEEANQSIVLSPIDVALSKQTNSIQIPSQNLNGKIVNINSNSTFTIPDEINDNASLLLGRTILKTNGNNQIAFYDKNDSQNDVLELNSDNFLIRQCDNSVNIDDFGISFISEDSFSIFGKNIPLCLTIPFKNIINDGSSNEPLLFGIEYDAEINNSESPTSVCIMNLSNGNCISYFSTNFNSSNINGHSYQYGVSENDLNKIGLRFFIDTTKNLKPTQITFKDLVISTTKPYELISINGSEIKNLLSDEKTKSNILVRFSGDQRLSQDLTKLPKTMGRCEINPRILVNNKTKSIGVTEDHIRYTTEDGSLCDTFSYQNLLQNQGYIVLVTSRNVKGLPLNICITNFYSKRCDIYTKLSENKEFTTQAFLLPPMGNSENGYDVNINNLAIKGTTSVNDLKSIVFVPFPYEMAVSANTDSELSKSTSENIDYEEINPLLYKIESPKSEYIALSLTSEQGWAAYSFNNSNAFKEYLNMLLPFIFGKKIDEKVMINNWSNGWMVNNNEDYILIVYLPQYLQYLGFAITLLTLAITFIRAYKNKLLKLTKFKNFDKI